jgi:hypothetical protein
MIPENKLLIIHKYPQEQISERKMKLCLASRWSEINQKRDPSDK